MLPIKSPMQQWFICQNEEVTGPFLTEEVKNQVLNALVSEDALIWGAGTSQWLKAHHWINQLSEVREIRPTSETQKWHYAFQGHSYGPMERDELIAVLRRINQPPQVLLWTKGMAAWAPLYDFHDLMSEAGVDQRAHPRAQIKGQVSIEGEVRQKGQLCSVSEGGFAARGLYVEKGKSLKVELTGDGLENSIHGTAHSVYSSEDGLIGFKFDQLASEARSLILDYVQSANEQTELTQFAA